MGPDDEDEEVDEGRPAWPECKLIGPGPRRRTTYVLDKRSTHARRPSRRVRPSDVPSDHSVDAFAHLRQVDRVPDATFLSVRLIRGPATSALSLCRGRLRGWACRLRALSLWWVTIFHQVAQILTDASLQSENSFDLFRSSPLNT